MVEPDDLTIHGGGITKKEIPPPMTLASGDDVVVAVRPGKMTLARRPPEAGENMIQGIITDALYLGTSTQYFLETDGVRTEVFRQNTDSNSAGESFAIGDKVWATWLPKSTLLFPQ